MSKHVVDTKAEPQALGMFPLVGLLAVVLAFVRVAFLWPHLVATELQEDLFKDFAHLFVGGLFGAFLATRVRVYLAVALALSAVELGCFLIARFAFH